MINESDFLRKYIQPFKPGEVSDYVLSELGQYVNNQDFSQCALVSKTADALSKWIQVVYNIARAKNQKDVNKQN